MLARILGGTGCAVVVTAVLLVLGQPAAQAGGGPGGNGNPFGNVTCGQANGPSCTVTAGTPGGQPAGKPGSPLAAGGPGCTPSPFGCVPPGSGLLT